MELNSNISKLNALPISFIKEKGNELNKKFGLSKEFLTEIVTPIASLIVSESKKEPLKIYISGGQGSGKTTLSYALKIILENCFDVRVANFSIDDLYLPKSERYRLSKKVHPLLKTRGVPGTHEIQLGLDTINSLVSQKNKETRIPMFSKKYDDRLSKSDWPIFYGTPNVIIFEGWCVGAVPFSKNFWKGPMNSLEQEHDPDGSWAKWVNRQLSGDYQDLFSLFDISAYIKSKNFKDIYKNRLKQEEEAKKNSINSKLPDRLMSENQVKNFVMHFERITKKMEIYMPKKCDIVIRRDGNEQFSFIKTKIIK